MLMAPHRMTCLSGGEVQNKMNDEFVGFVKVLCSFTNVFFTAKVSI